MKPEHFIYKSDDLYYMQNVPEEPNSNSPSFHSIDVTLYTKALERAKAEAVKVEDLELEVLVARHHYPTVENTIYTINMEEKIEVIEVFDESEISPSPYSEFKNIARIAAPKKEEESEDHLWYFVFQTYGGEFYHAAPRDEAAIISRIKREFEIKRKPL